MLMYIQKCRSTGFKCLSTIKNRKIPEKDEHVHVKSKKYNAFLLMYFIKFKDSIRKCSCTFKNTEVLDLNA